MLNHCLGGWEEFETCDARMRDTRVAPRRLKPLQEGNAIGALLTVVTSKHTRVFRKSIGEGLAAQNSGRIRVAIAKGDTLKKLSVRWPSGKTTELAPTADQSLIEIAE